MKCSICILNRNGISLLRDCLASLLNHPEPDTEIIVVDNASSDGSVAMVRADFPTVRLVENVRFGGFAERNNQAIKESIGNVVVLLNNDTIVEPGAVSTLVEALLQDEKAAIAGGRLIQPDGKTQFHYYRQTLPSAGSVIRELVFVDRIWRDNPWGTRFDPAVMQYLAQVPGAFMAVKREFLNETGLLDERFFFWYEDVELCHRAWSHGRKVLYVPNARITHLGGATFENDLLSDRSRWRFASLNKYIDIAFSPASAAVTRTAIILSLLGRLMLFSVASVIRAGDKKWKATTAATFHILREMVS